MISKIHNFLREELKKYFVLTEIDWQRDFFDVKHSCPDVKDVVEYLNKVKANANKKYGEREKFSAGLPFIHPKSSLLKNNSDNINIDFFIKQITSRPSSLINTNDKILKTGGKFDFVYKTGIPAFRGIAYDIENNKFIYVNTCPGAGACQAICYALKGNYIRYPISYDNMTKRLNYLLNNPVSYENQLYTELKTKCERHNAYIGNHERVVLRWNDSGDFFTKKYVEIADRVIKSLQKNGFNVVSYLYTKMADVATDTDFAVTNFSAGGNKKQSKEIDPEKQKMSIIIPKELFNDLDLTKRSDEKTLVNRISDKYNLKPETIISYKTLMKTKEGDIRKWNVIVTPNDGDDAAMRPDVRNVLLTQH